MSSVNTETKFRSLAEKNVAPSFIKAQDVQVTFLSEGNLIDKYSDIDYKALEYELKTQPLDFTMEEYRMYNRAVVKSRVDYVSGIKPLIHPTDHIAVPAFLENIVMQIGLCQDLKLGVTIKPAPIEDDDSSSLALDKIRSISMRLESIPGFACGFGYPRDKSGSWDFMTMQLIDNQIVRHESTAHPVYALMAAVVGPKLIQSVLNPLVRYGDSNIFEALLWQLTSV